MSDLPRALLCSFDVIPGPTGWSRRLTEYLRELSEHFSVVVLSAKTPDHSHIQRFHGARLLRVPVGAGDLPSRVQAFDRAVRRQLESEEYVVAHFTDPFSGYALCEHRESVGYRLIYEAHGFPSQELAAQEPQLESDRRFLARVRRQELFCLMNADRVVTGSEVTRAFIHGLGVSEEIVDVLRAPVDLASLAAETATEPVGSPMRVLYLGSQVEWQGLPTLLRAVQRAVREVELQLTIAGPAHVREQALLEDLIGELGLHRNVVFQPPCPPEELPRLLASADVGVVPLLDVHRNRVQGGPLAKVADYLAAGRPIIASDLPVTRELVPSRAGLFHPPGDAEALAAHLVRLAKAPQTRVQMGAAARDAARLFHDAAQIRRRMAGIYRKLLDARSQPPDPRDSFEPTPDEDPVTESNEPVFQPLDASDWPNSRSSDDVVRVVALSPLLPLPESASEGTSTLELPRPVLPPGQSENPTIPSDHLIARWVAEPEESPTPIVGPPATFGTQPAPSRSTAPAFVPRRFPPGRPTALIPAAPPSATSVNPGLSLVVPTTPSPATPDVPSTLTPLVPAARPPPSPATPPAPTPVWTLLETPAFAASTSGPLQPPMPETTLGLSPPAPQAPLAISTSTRVTAPSVAPAAANATPSAVLPPAPTPPAPRTPTPPTLPATPPAAPQPLASATSPTLRAKAPTLPATPQPHTSATAPALSATPPPLPPPATPPALPTRPSTRVDAPSSTGPAEDAARPAATLTVEPPSLNITPPPLPPPLGRLAEPEKPEDEEPVELAPEEVEPADDELDGPVEVSAVVLLDTIDPEGRLRADDDAPDESPAPVEQAAPGVPADAAPEHVLTPVPPPDIPSAETIPSNLDPWFAQLVHGYCPPEGAQFARPTPPTNFPGREGPPPATVQPTAAISQSIPIRSGDG